MTIGQHVVTGTMTTGFHSDTCEFYSRLGIDVSSSVATENVMISCFANPSAHKREDRNKSCSLHLPTGRWNCHGCGLAGNAFQAAVLCGHSDNEARKLAMRYGLFGESRVWKRPKMPGERQLREWREALAGDERLLDRLERVKGWTRYGILRCGLGWDEERITFPIRDRRLRIAGLVRYLPGGNPKTLAAYGSKRLLFPAPETLSRKKPLFVVEGEPDAVAVRSCRHQAVAIPGTGTWKPEWAQRLGGFKLIILPDCDQQGRELAEKVRSTMPHARVMDLDKNRKDGWDVGDAFREAAAEGGVWQMQRVLDTLMEAAA